MFEKFNPNKVAKSYYFNPEKFKIYNNDAIGFGGFIIFLHRDMYVQTYNYIKEIIRSSHIPWNLDTFLGDTLLNFYLDNDIISLTPYDGLQIVINDKDSQIINVNEYAIKVDYPSNYRNLKHKLLLKNKVIKESKSIKELFEEVKNV